jgi:hypothetical protein
MSDQYIYDPDSLFVFDSPENNTTTLNPTTATTPNNYTGTNNTTTMVYPSAHTTQTVATVTPSSTGLDVVTANISHLPLPVQQILTKARSLKHFTEERILTDNGLEGWILHIHNRQTEPGLRPHLDRYWYTPQTGKKMRSKPEVDKFRECLKATNGDENKAWVLFKSQKVKERGVKRTMNASEDVRKEPVTKRTRTKKVPKAKSSVTNKNDPKSQGHILQRQISESKLKPREPISMDMDHGVELVAKAEAKNPVNERQKLSTSKEQKPGPLSFTVDPDLPPVAESK